MRTASVTRTVLVVLGLLLVPGFVRAESPEARAERKLEQWRVRRANDPSNFSRFNRDRLLHGIDSGEIKLIGHDRELGASDPADARSKFVLIRSRSAKPGRLLGDKILGVATAARVEGQPVHLYDVDRFGTNHLGRMVRGVLTCPEEYQPLGNRAAQGMYLGWTANIHLPDWLTMPVLHVHGEFRQRPVRGRIVNWEKFLVAHDYRRVGYSVDPNGLGFELYTAPTGRRQHNWDVVAIAKGADGHNLQLANWLDAGGQGDLLVGRMIRSVAQTAVKRGTTAGKVLIDRDEKNVIVRATAFVEPKGLERLRRTAIDASVSARITLADITYKGHALLTRLGERLHRRFSSATSGNK